MNETATTEIYTLSLHDALPILRRRPGLPPGRPGGRRTGERRAARRRAGRSEEHTSELQSQSNLVCRLLLEKKKHRIATTDLVDPRDVGGPYRGAHAAVSRPRLA